MAFTCSDSLTPAKSFPFSPAYSVYLDVDILAKHNPIQHSLSADNNTTTCSVISNGEDTLVACLPFRMVFCGGFLISVVSLSGCQTSSHAENGAVLGGLLGAGTGAIIGHASGNTGAGAAIGAGVGALSGAAIGHGQDEVEAKNRAMIAQQLGRQVNPGAVTPTDVIAMVHAGVNEDLIINHVRAHGMATPLQTNDLIYLQQQNISPRLIAAMQAAPPPPQPQPQQPQTVIIEESAPPPVVIGYGPYYGPRYHHYHGW